MPRLLSGTLTGLVALAMLSLLPGSAGAQERTMHFRPVRPASAAVHDDRQNVTITKVKHGETTSVDFRVPAVPRVPDAVRGTDRGRRLAAVHADDEQPVRGRR